MMKGPIQLVHAARAPVQRHLRGRCGRHNTPVHRALTILVVVLHAKVVAHLVRNGRGHHANDHTVVLRNADGRLVRAHLALVRFADNVVLELAARQQVRIVVGVLAYQLRAPVLGELTQRRLALERDRYGVLLVPHDNAGEGNEDIERHVELSGWVCVWGCAT